MKFPPALLLTIGFCFNGTIHAQEEAKSVKPDVTLSNATLTLGFDTKNLALVSLKDLRSGHEFLESLPRQPILWLLDLEKPDGTPFQMRSSMVGKRKEKLSADKTELRLIWSGLEVNGEADAMDVTAIIDLKPDADRSYWRIEVENRSKCSLITVQFPYLSGISKPGQPSAAIPRHNWGNLERAITYTRGSYPSDIWPMQFLAVLEKDSGLYLAYEDPKTTLKYFDLKPGLYFSFTSFVENASIAGNDFTSPGPAAIGVSGPDWWKAAKMFRQWAIQQKWTSRGPLTQKSNIPEAAKNVGIWFNESFKEGDNDNFFERLQKAREFFDLPIAMQFYNWHRAAFDTEYPEYFPAKPGFKSIVETMTDEGDFVAPYINGRLQDANVPSAAAAMTGMAKKRDGKSYIEDYQSGAKLAPMCPASAYWQKAMLEVSQTLVNEYGVNAIYFDQISAAEPVQCFDPTHGHPLGGGSYWTEGYRQLLGAVKELKAKSGEPVLIASENTSDAYMDTVDAFLTWTPRHPNEIPLLTAVYSGYAIYFGSNAQVEEDAGLPPFAMIVGRDMIWGTQPGWIGIDTVSERGYYLRDVAQIRYAARQFFQFGELMGELQPLKDPGTMTGRWKNINRDGVTSDVMIPAVMSAIWKSPSGTLALAIVNLSGEERSFEYEFKPADFGVTASAKSQWQLNQFHAKEIESLGTAKGRMLQREEKLKPWELRVIEVAPVAAE